MKLSALYSSQLRVAGLCLAIVLATASTSDAFQFVLRGWFGVTTNQPLELPHVIANGNVQNGGNTHSTDFAKIFVNCFSGTAVASGYGYTNNRTNPPTRASFLNDPRVNGLCDNEVSNFTQVVCGRDATTMYSLFVVDLDATPDNNTDEQALASVSCLSRIN